MAEEPSMSSPTNSMANEAPEGHDFSGLNQISQDLLAVNDKNGLPNLHFMSNFNMEFYGMPNAAAEKACPWKTKSSEKLPPFICRTTEPTTHCPLIPEEEDANIAFKSGRCQVSEDPEQYPEGMRHFCDLWSEGGRQYSIMSHLKGHQITYETPFISGHDSLNRSIGRGVKSKAKYLTIISPRKLLELGYPITKTTTAMANYSLGTDKEWLYNTEWLMLWHVPREAIVHSYPWSEVQTKEQTLAGRSFRNKVVREVHSFDVRNGFTPSFSLDEDAPSSDEDEHYAEQRAKKANPGISKSKANRKTASSNVDDSSHTPPIADQDESEETYGEPDQEIGTKRKRIPQKNVTGFEPYQRTRFMDMHSFDQSAKNNGYAKTILRATVPIRNVYPLAKLLHFPSKAFLKRRDHRRKKEDHRLTVEELTCLRMLGKSTKAKPGEDSDAAESDDEAADRTVATIGTLTSDQHRGIAVSQGDRKLMPSGFEVAFSVNRKCTALSKTWWIASLRNL